MGSFCLVLSTWLFTIIFHSPLFFSTPSGFYLTPWHIHKFGKKEGGILHASGGGRHGVLQQPNVHRLAKCQCHLLVVQVTGVKRQSAHEVHHKIIQATGCSRANAVIVLVWSPCHCLAQNCLEPATLTTWPVWCHTFFFLQSVFFKFKEVGGGGRRLHPSSTLCWSHHLPLMYPNPPPSRHLYPLGSLSFLWSDNNLLPSRLTNMQFIFNNIGALFVRKQREGDIEELENNSKKSVQEFVT